VGAASGRVKEVVGGEGLFFIEVLSKGCPDVGLVSGEGTPAAGAGDSPEIGNLFMVL
jgi:hypothetical protein